VQYRASNKAAPMVNIFDPHSKSATHLLVILSYTNWAVYKIQAAIWDDVVYCSSLIFGFSNVSISLSICCKYFNFMDAATMIQYYFSKRGRTGSIELPKAESVVMKNPVDCRD